MVSYAIVSYGNDVEVVDKNGQQTKKTDLYHTLGKEEQRGRLRLAYFVRKDVFSRTHLVSFTNNFFRISLKFENDSRIMTSAVI